VSPAVLRYREEAGKFKPAKKFTVLLCGPSFSAGTSGAKLRRSLQKELEKNQFEVIPGEDEGLKDVQINITGADALTNEVEFCLSQCGAVVIVADSPGAFCELGAFTAYFSFGEHRGRFRSSCDFIVLMKKAYEVDKSFLNLGPAAVIRAHGSVEYVDFGKFDTSKIVERLKTRRAVVMRDDRGRPKEKKKA